MKRLLLSTLTLLVGVLCYAQSVSRSEAQALASVFAVQLHKASTPSQRAQVMRQVALAHVANAETTDADADAAYYAFNIGQDNGFVIVSGDERTEPILGYSDSGSFRFETLPENARAWLDELSAQINYIRRHQLPSQRREAPAASEPVMLPIAPMVTTLWNQSAPYNNLCPLQNGNRSVTGCVATAMAQVLYYHRANNPGYTTAAMPDFYTRSDSIHVDGIPAGTVIEWDKMLNSYSGTDYTDEQAKAVATLMLCCGVSVEMDYTSSASGAYSSDVPVAFKDYFGFHDATTIRSRQLYSNAEWEAMLYNELAMNRPMYYSGSSMGGGHAFVIDGYDGQGLFHVNWGWGGSSNGYFVISILNPGDNSGIGASSTTDGYSMGQQAVFNAQPKTVDNDVTWKEDKLRSSTLAIEDNTVGFSFFNYTDNTNDYNRGIAVRNSAGKLVVLSAIGTYNGLKPYTGWSNTRFEITRSLFSSASLPNGTYEIIPVSLCGTSTEWLPCERSDGNRVYANYNSSRQTVTLTYEAAYQKLTADGFTLPNAKDGNATQKVNFTLHNTGSNDFVGTVYLTATRSADSGYARTSRTGVAISAGDSAALSLSFAAAGADNYTLTISADYDATMIIGQTTQQLTVGSIVSNGGLSVQGTNIENMESSTLYGNRAKGTVELFNSNAVPFDGDINVSLFKNLHNGYYGRVSTYTTHATIPSLTRRNVAFEFDNLILDEGYWILFYYPSVSNRFGSSSTFTTTYAMMQYDADGNVAVSKPASSITVAEETAAVYIKGCNVSNITPNNNPNTLYYIGNDDEIPSGLQGKNIVREDEAGVISLTDGHDYYIPLGFTAAEVSYQRTPTVFHNGSSGWELITLPFSVESVKMDNGTTPCDWFHSETDTDKQFYVLQWQEYDAATSSLIFTDAEEMQANVPYLVGWPSTFTADNGVAAPPYVVFEGSNVAFQANAPQLAHTQSFNLMGTRRTTAVAQGLVLDAAGTEFQRYRGTMYVAPFRSYIEAADKGEPAATTLRIIAPTHTVNGIETITQHPTPNTQTAVYNLQGQRVQPNTKGIYIQNGKKIIIK